MKIIDGKGAIMGRLASYAAKELLKGEDIVILNCEEVIITGSRKSIENDFHEQRSRVGSSQKGPKHSKLGFRIVKRVVRGMLPDHRSGRGKIAYKKLKCYNTVPKEFEGKGKITSAKQSKSKFIRIKDISK
jgi:large subunit ribosomal protein L13